MTNVNNELEVLNAILIDVEQDEREACFDPSYYDDETWEKENGEQTRERRFEQSMGWHKGLTLNELLEYYGNKYDYILDRMNYTVSH